MDLSWNAILRHSLVHQRPRINCGENTIFFLEIRHKATFFLNALTFYIILVEEGIVNILVYLVD